MIQKERAASRLTPEAVKAYAYLHLTNDEGIPILPAAHHELWISLLCDESIKKLLLIAPPESAKTTWTISAYVGTYIAFYPTRSVIIGSTSGKVAEKRSMALRNAVESETFRRTFPDVLPITSSNGLKWSTDEWSVGVNGEAHPGRLHPTVAAYGTGGSVIGSRADLVIGDDLLDFDNTRTSHQRAFVEAWFYNSLLSRRKSRTGRAVVIGTAWHHADLISNLKRDGSWIVCHLPLLSETNQVKAKIAYPDTWTGVTFGRPLGQAKL